jgi:para-aminobenzoate synthetase/4-amino-4-deoxychorismate lyase
VNKPSETGRQRQSKSSHAPAVPPVRVLLHDPSAGGWLEFGDLREVIRVHRTDRVADGLRRMAEAVERRGLFAAGFVSYEAGPGLDAALRARRTPHFPLLWFGLFGRATPAEPPPPPPPADEVRANWRASVGETRYQEAIDRVRAYIRAGDTYQVNFTYRLRARGAGDPWAWFLRLTAAQPRTYGAFIDTGDWAVCSASPELFFRLDGRRIESHPMKGTAARGLTAEADAAQALALAASEKDRAENVMIVDMVRNDIGRIATPGSVHVPVLFRIEKYPTVWQMTSVVRGETDASLPDIFRALFPAASITGAPKVRTMEIVAGLERGPRGLYTGAIGYLAPGRRAQFNVAIRTLVFDRLRDRAEYGLGGGIVWDSDPASERRECATKARVLTGPPPPRFELLETLRWSPRRGYRLACPHLARLRASAARFDVPLQPAAARAALDACAAALAPGPHRVRLLVDAAGACRTEACALAPRARGPRRPVRVALAAAPVNAGDVFLYHKTTHRRAYEEAAAGRPGFDDVILANRDGEVTESTVANVLVRIGGAWWTPPVACGLLAGTLRARLLERGCVKERRLSVSDLLAAEAVCLCNSVRGVYAACLVAPGAIS